MRKKQERKRNYNLCYNSKVKNFINKNIPPAVKAELIAKNTLLEGGKATNFLVKKGVVGLKNQEPNEKITTFQNIVKNIQIKSVFTPNNPWEIQYKFKQSEGTNKIYLHNKFDKQRPSLIYHHGLGEIYDPLELNIIFDKSFLDRFNIFTIKISHHDTAKDIIDSFLNRLENIASAMAASFHALDELVCLHKSLSSTPVVACGVSMGGMVVSQHYFLKNSADYYFPLAAHPDFSRVLTDPRYKNVISNQDRLRKNLSFVNCFKVPSKYLKRPKNKIFPILGTYDLTVKYEDSLNWWRNYTILSLETGHSSIFIKKAQIQKYILSKISSD